MNKHRQRKLTWILIGLLMLGAASTLVMYALRQNINLFFTPNELLSAERLPKTEIKVGGMVKPNSIMPDSNDPLARTFVITDFEAEVKVRYRGVLPDLFKEGKGVVVHGKYENGQVNASQVLAKHDENYMPPQMKRKVKPV